MRCLSSLVLLALLATTANAQWYARGGFNSFSTDNPLVDQGGGHYTAHITGLFDNEGYEYKIADANWTGATTHPGTNGKVYTDVNGDINFHLYDQTTWTDGWYPNNTRRVGYNDHQQFDWEIVGSFNGWPGGAFDPNFALTDMGNGLHRGQFAMNAGIHAFKFRGLVPQSPTPPVNGVWDTTIGSDFGNTGGNNEFSVASNGDLWTFELDLPNGRFRYFTEAAPPGQEGDFNQDGFVNAADYTVWRDNFGSSTALPNDPNGTPVGTASYNTWKAHFGQGAAVSWVVRSPQLADQSLTDLGNGQYELNMTGLTPNSDYEFRVSKSDLSVTAPGSAIKVKANASGNINLNFFELDEPAWTDGWSPANEHRLGYDDPGLYGWEIVGAFNTWPSTNDPAFQLTNQSNGLYTGSFTFNTPGSYDFKFRHLDPTNPWNISIGNNFGNSAGNNNFTVTNVGELWHFELDLPNGRWRAYLDGAGAGSLSAVPEPGSLAIVMIGLVWGAAAGRRRR
jgi:hypothetical protein